MTALISTSHFKNINTDTTAHLFKVSIDSSFNSIKIYNGINVFIIEGDVNEIGYKNKESADMIKAKVKNQELVIKNKEGLLKNNKQFITVKVKDISSITVMDNSEVRTVGDLSSPHLSIVVNGKSAIYVSTKANDVKSFIKAGIGKVEIIGNFKDITVSKDVLGNTITTYY
jgi:hypothetical protein